MTNYIDRNVNYSRQRGAGFWSIAFNIGVLIFMAFSAAKIGSLYSDNYVIKKGLESLNEVPLITSKSSRAINDLLYKRYSVNNINLDAKEIEIKRQSNKLIVNINYERRVHIVSNLDVVVFFENHFEAVKH